MLAVYIVLGILYESYIHPITILSTIPSAGVGAMLALMLFHTDRSLIADIGLLLLIGIVKKNAIMMVDFALVAERDEGKNSADAIFEACLLRFRPIMMTTMAAIFGALPLVLSNGIGSELRRPLGITIVGGLIMSQALTLFTTPVVYLYLDRMRLWFDRMRKHPSAKLAWQASAMHCPVYWPCRFERLQLRAELQEARCKNPGHLQRAHARAGESHRRLENRGAKRRRRARQMVGNVR